MNEIALSADHAIELAELLEFVHDWTGTDRQRINTSLTDFTHSAAYDIDALRADLARFAFLLGGNGERLLDNEET